MYPCSHTWTYVHNVNIPIVHTNHLGLKHNGADSSKTVFTSKHLMLPAMALGLHSSCIHSLLDSPLMKQTHMIESLVKNQNERAICGLLPTRQKQRQDLGWAVTWIPRDEGLAGLSRASCWADKAIASLLREAWGYSLSKRICKEDKNSASQLPVEIGTG